MDMRLGAVCLAVLFVLQGIVYRRLRRAAYRDSVTETGNWARFEISVRRLCRKRCSGGYVMVSMDFRKFRVISDINGELCSNAMLKQAAGVLRRMLCRKERFARFSVDEFAVLMQCTDETQAVERVREIDAALHGQELLEGIAFYYGIYRITDWRMSVRQMYNYAGIARDCIKNSHEQNIEVFDESMREALVREKVLECHMDQALREGEFCVYLQAKYLADGGGIGGAEALARWVSPALGFLSPGEFIPLFEKNGFITKLDIYMLRSICELLADWQSQGRELCAISVNLSRVHLADTQLAQRIIHLADAYGVPHRYLEIEITESAFFEDKKTLLKVVTQLQQAGFSVSMDDFGAGYSSLNSLKDLPLDVVKLDAEFFRYRNNRERSESIIRDTVRLVKHLNMKIVAEGIETGEQADFLRRIGCDYIQGYYYAKPVPVMEFERLAGYR